MGCPSGSPMRRLPTRRSVGTCSAAFAIRRLLIHSRMRCPSSTATTASFRWTTTASGSRSHRSSIGSCKRGPKVISPSGATVTIRRGPWRRWGCSSGRRHWIGRRSSRSWGERFIHRSRFRGRCGRSEIWEKPFRLRVHSSTFELRDYGKSAHDQDRLLRGRTASGGLARRSDALVGRAVARRRSELPFRLSTEHLADPAHVLAGPDPNPSAQRI